MNERALTQAQPVGMAEWSVMREQSELLIKTGFLPNSINSPEKAVAIILQGRELGIPTMAALQTINVIQGKPTVSPQLMLALIYRSHQLVGMDIQSTDTDCTVTMQRKGVGTFSARFSLDDARRLGLADKDNWKKQPRVMLKWRAVAACAREAFSDVVLGLYTPEEMGAEVEVTDDGSLAIVESRSVDRVTGEIREPEAQRVEEMRERLAPALEGWPVRDPGEEAAPDPQDPHITSEHDPKWQGWLKATLSARHYGVSYPELQLPIRQSDLELAGRELAESLRRTKAQREAAGVTS